MENNRRMSCIGLMRRVPDIQRRGRSVEVAGKCLTSDMFAPCTELGQTCPMPSHRPLSLGVFRVNFFWPYAIPVKYGLSRHCSHAVTPGLSQASLGPRILCLTLKNLSNSHSYFSGAHHFVFNIFSMFHDPIPTLKLISWLSFLWVFIDEAPWRLLVELPCAPWKLQPAKYWWPGSFPLLELMLLQDCPSHSSAAGRPRMPAFWQLLPAVNWISFKLG